MCCFMNDHIVREASEDPTAPLFFEVVRFLRFIFDGILTVAFGFRKVAEQQGSIILRVKGIGVRERVWCNLKLVTEETPAHTASQGEFESRERTHDDGIDVLGVKLRIVQKNFVPFLIKGIVVCAVFKNPILEWRMQDARRGVVIDNLDAVTAWSRR